MVQIAGNNMLSETVTREKAELLSATPRIDVERLKLLLDAYQEDDMKPAVIRRAKLFNRLCNEKTIYIDGNPIAGTLTQYKYGAYPFPEEGCAWMERTSEFYLPRGRAQLTPEDGRIVDAAVSYWRHRNLFSLVQDVIHKALGVDIRTFSRCGVWIEASPGGAAHILVPDYQMVLSKGLRGIIADIEQAQQGLNMGEPGVVDRWYFYQAARTSLGGMIVLANRYADLALKLAAEEKSESRRRQLEEISRTCRHVPENPPRSFREAVQSFWFIMLGIWLEAPKALTAPPATLTRSLYPFYRQDREAGLIDDEEVIELLQLLFLRFNHLAHVLPPHGYRMNQSRLGLQLSVGGLTADGEDATSELDWLVLEAQRRIRLPEPLVNLVYHDKLAEDFLLKCVELLRTGIGQPAFHNSRTAVERHLYHHRMPLEVARTFVIAGCVQSFIPGYMDGYFETRLNIAKMIELALGNGKDPMTGIQLGPQTGDAGNFKSYGDFYEAFNRQVAYFMSLTHDVSRTAWTLQQNFPTPFGSSFVNDCIKEGRDVSTGGARYSFGDGVCLVGVIDAANSLAAVKNLVYEDKKLTLERLRQALADDFEGHEDVQQMCLNAPKYGNDDEYVDAMARGIYNTCYKLHSKSDYLGRPVMPSAYSVTGHVAFGEFTGALPNGKRATKPLVDASVSAQAGTDKNGPTALVKSAAKVLDTVKYGSSHLNMKFHPTALKGTSGARNLLSLIKTYFDLGGYHVQFNCISGETLRAAQLHPENYKELVVRVAGYSAYFVTLDKDVQEDIIKRTELSFR